MQQKNLNVYATAHLSGDVANAVTLLKRMTRPSSRKHKAGLLIPSADLAACQVTTVLGNTYFWLRNIAAIHLGDLGLLITLAVMPQSAAVGSLGYRCNVSGPWKLRYIGLE